jgi:hypothetical protein
MTGTDAVWNEVVASIALPNVNEPFGKITDEALAVIGVLILAVPFLFFGGRWLANRMQKYLDALNAEVVRLYEAGNLTAATSLAERGLRIAKNRQEPAHPALGIGGFAS